MEKKYYKLMWLPNSKHTIWDMKTEKEVDNSLEENYTTLINRHIDFAKWISEYRFFYKKWLDDDDETIFDIQSPLLNTILGAINKVNQEVDESKKLYYWFDIDRTFNEDFVWMNCPVTKLKLKNLGLDYFYTNRLISDKVSLVLPDKK